MVCNTIYSGSNPLGTSEKTSKLFRGFFVFVILIFNSIFPNKTTMKKLILFFLISFVLAVLNGYFFNYINDTYLHFDVNYNKSQNISKNELNFIAIFIAPLIETFIFQYLPYLILSKWIRLDNKAFCILIMSTIFASMHYYNWLYIVMTFFGGIILNNFYIYYHKHIPKYSFVLTVLFHALFNLYGFLFIM